MTIQAAKGVRRERVSEAVAGEALVASRSSGGMNTPATSAPSFDAPPWMRAHDLTRAERLTSRGRCVVCEAPLRPLQGVRVAVIAVALSSSGTRAAGGRRYLTPHVVCCEDHGHDDPVEVTLQDVCRPSEVALLEGRAREELDCVEVVLDVAYARRAA